MDFDDLDDAIEERIAAGDTAGMEVMNFSKEKEELAKYFAGTTGMSPIPRDHRLPMNDFVKGKLLSPGRCVGIRAFFFYGPGGCADALTGVLMNCPDWLEMAVYEWPGHGSRKGEPPAASLDELAEDAFQALKPSIDQVKKGAEMEGAPFALLGHSVGCQLLTLVAKKVVFHAGITPSAVVVLDRAPLQFPLFTPAGQEMLASSPTDLLRAYCYETFSTIDKSLWAQDLKFASETKDAFFHKFDCNMLLMKAQKNNEIAKLGAASGNYTTTVLEIEGTGEVLHLPVEVGTKVGPVRDVVAKIFAHKRGAKVTVASDKGMNLADGTVVHDKMIVKGVEDFQHPRYSWPYPVAIIGAGFYGVKMAMEYMLHKNENIVMFDRHARAGGDAWHEAATKHSKIQTDFGAFNIWWGHQFTYTGKGGFGAAGPERIQFQEPFEGSGAGSGVDYHPKRAQVLNQLNFALEEYNILQYCKFETEVSALEILGDKDAFDRSYKLTLKQLNKAGAADKHFQCSIIYHFPGAYDVNRIIDYPGEKEFGGQIGYGMGNGQGGLFVWDDGRMKGSRAAVLGNGAFAVENVRSCCEHGAHKVYLVTRRKSLACPRIPCWFCHQGPGPTPAWMLLNFFKPMYELAGMGDPWSYYAVITTADRSNVTISQSSRFGIGDVTFICHAYGLLEYRVGVLERCSYRTLHLSTGEKLEDMYHICKALGLLGDPRVDKLHALTHRIGPMLNGDYRRILSADATGMHAANFTTFSAGPGACNIMKQWYYLHNHPWEVEEAIKQGMLKVLPVHKISNTQPDQTVYMANVQYEMACGGLFFQYFPNLGRNTGDEESYKYCLLHSMHPTWKFLEYAKADWDRYQKMFKENNGCENQPYLEYPYTEEIIRNMFEEYNKKWGWNLCAPEGPSEEYKQRVIDSYRESTDQLQLELIPHLVKDSKLHENCPEGQDPFALAAVSYAYPTRKKIMASSSESALDFDKDQFDEWRNWVADGYTCEIENVDATSSTLLEHKHIWPRILKFLQLVSAHDGNS